MKLMPIGASLLILLGVAGGSWAADPVATSPAAPVVAADVPLTNETLKALLTSMNLDPKAISKGFLISIKREDWTFYVQLTLSGDATKLGLNANLGQVENPDVVTAAQWKALLTSNADIDPSFFYFDANLKKVMLHRVLDNRAITAEFLKRQIDQFVANIQSTEAVWNFAK